MTNLGRLVFVVLSLAAVLVLAALFEPKCAPDLGLDSYELVGVKRILIWEGLSDGEKVEIRARERRARAKEQIVTELFAGRLTLFQAGAGFRRLNDEFPRELPPPLLPGDSDEERVCRQVIDLVRSESKDRSHAEANALGAKFEEELRLHKERYGRAILTDSQGVD